MKETTRRNIVETLRAILIIIIVSSFGLAVVLTIDTAYKNKNISAEEQKETVIAEIAMPDGSVVYGEIEKCTIIANKVANVTINGIKYTTGIDNVVIIKGGAGIQEE